MTTAATVAVQTPTNRLGFILGFPLWSVVYAPCRPGKRTSWANDRFWPEGAISTGRMLQRVRNVCAASHLCAPTASCFVGHDPSPVCDDRRDGLRGLFSGRARRSSDRDDPGQAPSSRPQRRPCLPNLLRPFRYARQFTGRRAARSGNRVAAWRYELASRTK